MESDLARCERQKKLDEQKKQREKAKMFSKDLKKGTWKSKAAVTVLDTKKKKKIKKLHMDIIQSPDEDVGDSDDDDEPLLEGFHLLKESVHCINIPKADQFRAYFNQICSELVCSIYWACKAVRHSSLIGDEDLDVDVEYSWKLQVRPVERHCKNVLCDKFVVNIVIAEIT